VASLSFALPSLAAETKRIVPTSLSPPTEEIRLYPNKGVSIAYFQIGQVIETVWLDNKSRVLLSSDGCLSGLNQKCAKNSATVLHLSRLASSPFPVTSNHSSLTVVTIDSNGQRYTYRYNLEIIDKRSTKDTLTLLEYVAPPPPPIRAVKRITRTAIVAPIILGKKLRIAAERAQQNGLLFDSKLIARTDRFIQLIEQGFPPTDAARQAGVSAAYVNALYKLTP
jgi:hypothetical protein